MRYFVFAFFLLFALSVFGAEGLTPQSPTVLQAVARAVAFLKKNGSTEPRLGGRALVALALYKAGVDPETDSTIQGALEDIQKAISDDGTVTISDHIYTAGIIILLLAEIDPDRYRRELIAMGRFLQVNQCPDGSWIYPSAPPPGAYPSGDMSMTQYATMGLWTLHQIGINISGNAVDRLGRWLTTVQSAEGTYAYQTHDFGTRQWRWETGVNRTLSMTAAGMASVYVCRDLFGFNGQNRTWDGEVHEAFRERAEDIADIPLGNYRLSVRKEVFETVQVKGNAWMERNYTPVKPTGEFFYYYLYALERYSAFKELAENEYHESPPWYNRAATVLLDKQATDGSWKDVRSEPGTSVDTAYALLFLLRSTRRSFEKWKVPNIFDGGNLRGGRGLPTLTDDIKIENGVVVSLSEMGNAEQLMERLDDLQDTDEETLIRLAELPAEDVENLLKRNKAKLKTMVGHTTAVQRFAAVNLLGKSGNVSNAPALIYALTDPDHNVAEAAQTALLRLSRQTTATPFPKPEEPNVEHRMAAMIQHWKEWYRTIDPDALFEER